jgi:c(7)-type cytochrome triheme protein
MLPAPHTYAASEISIGKVTFRHETHVTAGGACNPCHPQPFRMAAAPALADGGMHEAGACGACHDGKKSFATTDDTACTRCHAETGARP